MPMGRSIMLACWIRADRVSRNVRITLIRDIRDAFSYSKSFSFKEVLVGILVMEWSFNLAS